jgi:hypothetical protein
MATLIRRGNTQRLQFRVFPNEDRQSIALGAMDEDLAKAFKKRVETLVKAMLCYGLLTCPTTCTRKWPRPDW